MAQSIFGAAIEHAGLSADFEMQYVRGVTRAAKVLTTGMNDLDAMNYNLAAFRHENDMPPIAPLTEASLFAVRRRDG